MAGQKCGFDLFDGFVFMNCAQYPRGPHQIAFYLKELAADLHAFYNAERILVDEPRLRAARLSLLLATRQVLRNGLAMIGVSAPERM